MELSVYYLIIYLAEAITWAVYVSNIFRSKRTGLFRFLSLFLIYAALFIASQQNIVLLNICCFVLGNMAYILLCYSSKWYVALFHSSVATTLMCLCEVVVYPFVPENMLETSIFPILIIWAVFSKTLYSSLLFLLAHILNGKEMNHKNSSYIIFQLIFIPIISTIITFILYIICANYNISVMHGWLIAIGSILLLLMNILLFCIYANSQKRNQAFTEMQLLLQKEHDFSEYYKILLEQTENQRILIHDIKNHLHTISLLNEQKENQKIDAYIQQLTQSPALRNAVRICDNKLLNMILYQYQNQCSEKNIIIQLDIRKAAIDFMEEYDITSLFCNLLDNAVESAEKMSDSYIDLKIDRQDSTSFTVITLVNSCRISPFSKNGTQLISQKKDPLRHGYGMKSIGKIVEKYHGAMQTYYDSDNLAFHTIIMLKS